MPILTKVDHERREVQAIAVGPVTFEDVVTHLSLERHEDGLSYPEFMDFRGAGIAFTPDETRKMADLILGLGRETSLGRTAFLVSSDDGFDTVLKLAAMVKDVSELKPFRDEAEAHAWLAGKAAKGHST